MSSEVEQPERKNGMSPVPIGLVVLLALLGYGALLLLNAQGGGFNAQVYSPYSDIDRVLDSWPPTGPDPRAGEKVFNKYCIVCHQATGLGMPGQFPPLAGSEWVGAKAPNRIIRIVLNGLQGPIEVKGQQFNNTMLPWKDTLKDDEIAAVLTFVRGNKAWGNNAAPVTEAEVKAIREKIKDRSNSFTPDELQKLSDGE
jgi:mono/diheme cytochrome c family protein